MISHIIARLTRVLLGLVVLVPITSADIITFNNEKIQSRTLLVSPISMVSSETVPSEIKLDLEFSRDSKSVPDISFVLIGIHPSNMNKLQDLFGKNDKMGRTQICCNRDLTIAGIKCKTNQLIVNEDIADVVTHQEIGFASTDLSSFSASKNITGESFYILGVRSCELNAFDMISMSGTITVKHPYGYLSPIDYPNMPFYTYMSLAYFAIGSVWMILNVMHREEVMQVQNCISCVLVLCLIEMLAWFFYYDTFNNAGTRQMGPFVLALVSSTVRRTVSRMLVVAVSLGFGVVRPSLGADRNRVFIAGSVYFAFETALQLYLHLRHNDGTFSSFLLFLLLSVSFCDGGFYLWIFSSLKEQITQLQERRQALKLQVMSRFAKVLMTSLVAAVTFGLFRVFIVQRGLQLQYWRWTFLLYNGFAQQLYLAILMAIAILWRPSSNSRRIAYAEQIDGEDRPHDEDDFSLQLEDRESPLYADTSRFAFEIGSDDDSATSPVRDSEQKMFKASPRQSTS